MWGIVRLRTKPLERFCLDFLEQFRFHVLERFNFHFLNCGTFLMLGCVPTGMKPALRIVSRNVA